MIGDRQQRIGVRRQVDANDVRLLVHDMVDKPRILVAEPVVVLTPNMGSQQVIQRSDRTPPGNFTCNLKPFRMLIKHRINNVNEGFIAGEEAVPPGEQVSLQPTLA